MITCKICHRIFEKNFARHVRWHYKEKVGHCQKLEYFHEQYRDEYDIIHEYMQNKKSASKIGCEISDFGLFPVGKCDVLVFLGTHGIKTRTTSEAVKAFCANGGGPWNKGETKETHASIRRYSESRMGKNNPIFTLTEQERKDKIYYWCFKSKEELKKIRKQISTTLKEGYAMGRILHTKVRDPTQHEKTMQALVAGWKHAYENGLIKRQAYSSSYERKVALALVRMNVEHVQQKAVDGRYRYDFFLNAQNLLIEFHGDYWHCFPPLYEQAYVHPHKNTTAKEIWEYDETKREYAISHGYNHCVIWEHELKDLDDDEIEDFLNELIKNYENSASN